MWRIRRLLKALRARTRGPWLVQLVGETFFWFTGHRRSQPHRPLRESQSILVVRLDEIGDVVLMSPFLRELRFNAPHAWITLVVKPSVFNLVELCPYVNEVLTYDWITPGRTPTIQRHGQALKLAAGRLWHRHFDIAISPRRASDEHHATFLVYFSGARMRLGYSENITLDWLNKRPHHDILFTHRMTNDPLQHEVDHNLDVLRFLNGAVEGKRVEVWLSEEDRQFGQDMWANRKAMGNRPVIGICPGAGAPDKMWPLGHFIFLAEWLVNFCGAQLLIVGSTDEVAIGEAFERHLGDFVVNIIGKTSLRQTASAISRCSVFVSNDTGPMHIAAAVGVPVVELSCHPKLGSNPKHMRSPIRFGPRDVPSVVLQPERAIPPCSTACIANQAHCIKAISVEDAIAAVSRLLRQ